MMHLPASAERVKYCDNLREGEKESKSSPEYSVGERKSERMLSAADAVELKQMQVISNAEKGQRKREAREEEWRGKGVNGLEMFQVKEWANICVPLPCLVSQLALWTK